MKLINSSFEIYEQGPGLEGIYRQIEIAGRTCYKSEDKITGDSAKGFVERMVKSGHKAMLEHGTVYLMIPNKEAWDALGDNWVLDNYRASPYSVINCDTQSYYITTNYRVLVENGWLDDLKYLCEPTEHHERRVTVKFICDRGVSHEFVRHRVFSFAQESTRYCNYSKDKFGNELTFIIPSWVDTIEPGTYEDDHEFPSMWGHDHWMESIWFDNMIKCEKDYITMVREYLTPQQARQILPNSLKTELVMTGFVSDWQHFFRLRTSIIAETGKPHPDASALADPLYKEFIERGYMEPLV